MLEKLSPKIRNTSLVNFFEHRDITLPVSCQKRDQKQLQPRGLLEIMLIITLHPDEVHIMEDREAVSKNSWLKDR